MSLCFPFYLIQAFFRFLLQYPLKPKYSEPPQIDLARFRPNACRLELTIPYDVAICSRDTDGSKPPKMPKLTSSRLFTTCGLGIGVIRAGGKSVSYFVFVADKS